MLDYIDGIRSSLIDAICDKIMDDMCDISTPELERIYIKIACRKPFKLLDCRNFSDCESEEDCAECTTKLMVRFGENDYYWNEIYLKE